MTPDRSEALPVVPLTLTDPAVSGRNAEVSTASQVWSLPLVAVTVCSAVHPRGANAWDTLSLSPHTHAMTN